ncbi:MAG: aminoglycoside N(3)-acetyltransferase [Stackebrandtia sp.]
MTSATVTGLADAWRRIGVTDGNTVLVHAALSSLGPVTGGAETVVASLCAAVGETGNVVVPTFTPQVTDPEPEARTPTARLCRRRDAVEVFHPGLPSAMGAIPEALRALPEAVRSAHPQVSVAAVGRDAPAIVSGQPLGFAVGPGSPFDRVHDLDGWILLIGVGHDRNTFLHYAESQTPKPRLKLRRFPTLIDGERVWLETVDVADDNGRYFPLVGGEFETSFDIPEVMVGQAACRLIPARQLVSFAVPRLTELLAEAAAE